MIPRTQFTNPCFIEEAEPPFTIRILCGQFLEEFRSDPEIDRLHLELFGW